MFEPCKHIRNNVCPLAGHAKDGTKYCGFVTQENRVDMMKKCPDKKKREKFDNEVKLAGK